MKYGRTKAEKLTLKCAKEKLKLGDGKSISKNKIKELSCSRRNEPNIIRTPGTGCSKEGADGRK